MNRIEDVYGLTPSQQGMYLHALNKTTDAYNLYYLFELDAETDLQILEQALRLLALRHPVLRTAFAAVDGSVKQVVLNDRQPYMETIDPDSAFSEDSLKSIVKEESEYLFDLQKDSLMRCMFIRFSDRRFFFLHMHHLIADGWSMSVLFEDLIQYYLSLAGNTTYELLKNKIKDDRKHYASFASYANLIRSYDSSEAQEYWDNLLSDADICTLPKACGRHAETRMQRRMVLMDSQLSEQMESFARLQHVSVNSVIESAFSLALQKYTGSSDIVYNKVISGKSIGLPNLERTVGPMINTVPVRINRPESISLSDFLQQVHNQSVQTNKYGYLSLSEIYRRNGIDPAAVDIIFAFGNYDAPVTEGEKSPLRLISYKEETEYPLTVNVFADGDTYCMQCTFDSHRVPEPFVLALENSFIEIAGCFIGSDVQEDADVSSLIQLTSAEKQTLLQDFNNTTKTYDKTKSIYEMFAEQAEKNPEKKAIIFDNRSISYAELLRRIDEAAARLKKSGIGRADTVAVYLDRSPLLIVLQIAVIKLGATFLPADRRYPAERLQFLCKDCNVRLLITDADVSIDFSCETISPEILEGISADGTSADAVYAENCYIIYTSGSTGAPKGCLLKQEGLINFCINNNTLDLLNQKPDNVFACVNSVAFDYFIAESLLPLLNGFTVVLCDENESLNQAAFLELAEKHHINVVMTTPTRLNLFYDDGADCACLNNLDCICTSGEPLNEKLLKRIYDVSRKAVVYNPLGPSECSVWALGGELDRNAGIDIHIGKPIANAQIYILDKDMNPVPVGVTGELCIAGDGVGAGYFNRPELTKEKFVENPFGDGKLYKTGDLAYWREDGNGVFVGRNDYQVKINGQRVELGEIETALLSVDGVDSTAVLLQKDNTGKQVLCAFYSGREIPSSDLRSLLSKTLPRYMIPQSFTHLDTMPLTTNGKINRKILMEARFSIETQEMEYMPPQMPSEEIVCRAFCELFGLERVGRNDSFYDLGGTSLQLVQLLSKPPFDVLSATDFLHNPTPAGIAGKLDNTSEKEYTLVVPLYTPANSDKAVILFPYAGGDASAYTALTAKAREEDSDISLFFVDWDAAENSMDIESEIRTISKEMKVCFYSHCAGSALAMKLLDNLNAEGILIHQYIAAASIPPGRLKAGFNIWEHLSDKKTIRILTKAGLNLDENGKMLLQSRLESFRRQTSTFSNYFASKTKKTNVSLTAVISRKDPLTSDFKSTQKNWQRVVTEVNKVVFIDEPTHYFQNTNPELLLDLFSELML